MMEKIHFQAQFNYCGQFSVAWTESPLVPSNFPTIRNRIPVNSSHSVLDTANYMTSISTIELNNQQ